MKAPAPADSREWTSGCADPADSESAVQTQPSSRFLSERSRGYLGRPRQAEWSAPESESVLSIPVRPVLFAMAQSVECFGNPSKCVFQEWRMEILSPNLTHRWVYPVRKSDQSNKAKRQGNHFRIIEHGSTRESEFSTSEDAGKLSGKHVPRSTCRISVVQTNSYCHTSIGRVTLI